MPQTNQFLPAVNPSKKNQPLQVDALGGNLLIGEGISSALNIIALTQVKATAGRMVRVNVITAGSTAGTINDTTGAASAANEIFSVPNIVGTYQLLWPCVNGIQVTPGTAQVLAVSYT